MYIVLPDNTVWTKYHEDTVESYIFHHGIEGEPFHFNTYHLPVIHSDSWFNPRDGRTYLIGRLVGYTYKDIRNGVPLTPLAEPQTGFSFSIIGRKLRIVFAQRKPK